MSQHDITPALTRAEWAGVLARQSQLGELREQFLDTPFSGHALAALLLYGEPYGFSAQDVEDETEVAAYCAKMAAEHDAAGNAAVAATFRLLGERHRVRAVKIAALLPPMPEG
ncbi:MAG: hypothetical protein JO180_00825 [Gemmatirosa sp.]|nr:hypothetical protein [Gemmatirosa sp.]